MLVSSALELSTMTYALLKLAHIIGAVLIGSGLIGVWLSDLRCRPSRELVRFSKPLETSACFTTESLFPALLFSSSPARG